MNRRKFELPLFSFYDLSGMQKHLEKQAARGWMLCSITPFCWRYRKIPPAALRFSVSCRQRIKEFDPEPGEEQLIFRDFCKHAGWEPVAASGYLQVFCNREEAPVPIETEPLPVIRSVHRIALKTLPVWLVLLVLSFCMSGSFFWSLIFNPVDLLANATACFGPVWILLFVWCGADLVTYLLWRRRALRVAGRGLFLPTRGCRGLLKALVAVALLAAVCWFIMERRPGLRLFTSLYLLIIVLLVLAVYTVKTRLKNRKIPAKINMTATLATDILLSFLLTGALLAGMVYAVRGGFVPTEQPPPLIAATLAGVPDEQYRSTVKTESSLFVERIESKQVPLSSSDASYPRLQYTLIKVRIPALYDLCLRSLTGSDTPTETDPTPWNAVVAYRVGEDFLICWEDRLVRLAASPALTEEQIRIAAEQLTEKGR